MKMGVNKLTMVLLVALAAIALIGLIALSAFGMVDDATRTVLGSVAIGVIGVIGGYMQRDKRSE